MLSYLRYLLFLRYSLFSLILMVILSLSLSLEVLFMPGLGKLLYDRLLVTMDTWLLMKFLGIQVYIIFYAALLSVLFSLIDGKASFRIGNQIKMYLLKRLYRVKYSFFLDHDSGTLLKRLHEDSNLVAYSLVRICVILCNLAVIFSIAVMFHYIAPFLLHIYVFLLAVSVVWAILWMNPAHFHNMKIGHSYSKMYSQYGEMVTGIREIKSNNLQDVVLNLAAQTAVRLKWSLILNRCFGSMIWQLSYFFPMSAYVMILTVGMHKIAQGEIGVGMLLGSLSLVWTIYNPVMNIIATISHVQAGVAAAKRIQVILHAPLEPMKGQILSPFQHEIRFNHFSFSYLKNKPVLRDIQLRIPKGGTIGIVGKSGSGKTTLLYALMRFFDEYEGSATIDGVELSRLQTESVRKQMLYVSQDVYIFEDTLRRNIDFWGIWSDAEIFEILHKAKLDDFYSTLDNGLDSMLGIYGAKMSGGEKQRIAIARCFASTAPIIILDEITASLDSVNEQQILVSLWRHLQGRTVLCISHRLAAIAQVDIIYVLKDGYVTEQGTHQELLAKNGEYSSLFPSKPDTAQPSTANSVEKFVNFP